MHWNSKPTHTPVTCPPSHLAVGDRVAGRVLKVRHVAQHFTCPHTLAAGENRERERGRVERKERERKGKSSEERRIRTLLTTYYIHIVKTTAHVLGYT